MMNNFQNSTMESWSNPLLSICIPTYNRGEYLRKTLNSILTGEIDNSFEIVVSDNCSSDNTKQIVEDFQKRFSNIKYNRNEKNIFDKNFLKVLDLGSGEFLKLINDTLIFKQNSLSLMKDLIKKSKKDKAILFMSNNYWGHKSTIVECTNLNQFINEVSYVITWIGGFGIWKEDYLNIKEKDRYADYQLLQTDLLLQNFLVRKKVVVSNVEFCKVQTIAKKGGYNFVKVFVNNYLSLLKIFVKSNNISNKNYINEKRRLLFYHVIPIICSQLFTNDKSSYQLDGFFKTLSKFYNFFEIGFILPVGAVYYFLRKGYHSIKPSKDLTK